MFKARLISNPKYFDLLKKVTILKVLLYAGFFILGLLFINLFSITSAWRIFFIPLLLVTALMLPKLIYNRKIKALSGEYWLEIDPYSICIKDDHEMIVNSLTIEPGDHIIAREKYVQEDDHWKLLTGDFQRNKIIVNHKAGTNNYYFKPDSKFSITQLETILNLWQEKGCKVERIKS